MIVLDKYKLISFINYRNSVKIKRYLNNITPINNKNYYSVSYDCNFYNLFLRSFLYFFFIMYTFNHFTILLIKDRPKKTIKLQYSFLNVIDHYLINNLHHSNY